jgi:hypothetical protein
MEGVSLPRTLDLFSCFCVSASRQKRPITEVRPEHRRLTGHANRIGKVPLGASCADLGHARLWFALDEMRPLACFAGLWTNLTSVRKVKESETTNEIFAFLTTEPNAEAGAVHPKAMPMILTTPDEVETWMAAAPNEALKPQRPLPNGTLEILTRGLKEDPAEPSR